MEDILSILFYLGEINADQSLKMRFSCSCEILRDFWHKNISCIGWKILLAEKTVNYVCICKSIGGHEQLMSVSISRI